MLQFLNRLYGHYSVVSTNITHSIVPEPHLFMVYSHNVYNVGKLIVCADYVPVMQKVFPECLAGEEENVTVRIVQSLDLVRLHEYKIDIRDSITITYSDEASLYYAFLDLRSFLLKKLFIIRIFIIFQNIHGEECI